MPAVHHILQPQRLGHGAGSALVRLAFELEQQKAAAPRRDAYKKVFAQFELLGAERLLGPLLAEAQHVADLNGDGGCGGHYLSPSGC